MSDRKHIRAYFISKAQDDHILDDLEYWNHFDTYGADICWTRYADYYEIHGHAVCGDMIKKLKRAASRVEHVNKEDLSTPLPKECTSCKYHAFFDSVSCLLTEGVEFMTKDQLYEAIKKEWRKSIQ